VSVCEVWHVSGFNTPETCQNVRSMRNLYGKFWRVSWVGRGAASSTGYPQAIRHLWITYAQSLSYAQAVDNHVHKLWITYLSISILLSYQHTAIVKYNDEPLGCSRIVQSILKPPYHQNMLFTGLAAVAS
jgi:hypothetical protein